MYINIWQCIQKYTFKESSYKFEFYEELLSTPKRDSLGIFSVRTNKKYFPDKYQKQHLSNEDGEYLQKKGKEK